MHTQSVDRYKQRNTQDSKYVRIQLQQTHGLDIYRDRHNMKTGTLSHTHTEMQPISLHLHVPR